MNAIDTDTDVFFFSRGQEVTWKVAIPGLDIEIDMTAVVLTVENDDNLGEVLTILPWGQKLAWVAWSNASVSVNHAVALEDLRATGRVFADEHVSRIVAHATANY